MSRRGTRSSGHGLALACSAIAREPCASVSSARRVVRFWTAALLRLLTPPAPPFFSCPCCSAPQPIFESSGNMSADAPREVKVVLLGDAGVGKSSLVLRFVTGSFDKYSESTIGCVHSPTRTALRRVPRLSSSSPRVECARNPPPFNPSPLLSAPAPPPPLHTPPPPTHTHTHTAPRARPS